MKTNLLSLAVLLVQCTVAPMLESPRVKSGIKVEASCTRLQNSMDWQLDTSFLRGGIPDDREQHPRGALKYEIAPMLKCAILDRIEFGGTGNIFMIHFSWDGRLKVNVVDVGAPLFGRNVACALIVGGKGYRGEWDLISRKWAGLSVGTLHRFGTLDLEAIVMPTIGKSYMSSLSDGVGVGAVSYNDLLVNYGVMMCMSGKLYASAAMSSFHPFNVSHSIINRNHFGSHISRIRFSSDCVGYNIVLGYRFGFKTGGS